MRCYRNAKDPRRKICRNAGSYNILREGFRNIQKIKTGYPESVKPAEDLLPRRFYMQEKSSCRSASGIKPDTVYHTLKQNIRFLHIFLIGDKTEIYVSTADIH